MSEKNKCHFCGLRVTIYEDTSEELSKELSNDDWNIFRKLQAEGIIPDGYPRKIHVHVGGRHADEAPPNHVEYCAVDSKKWNIDEKCDYFQLINSNLNTSDHISNHITNKNAKLGHTLGFIAIGVSLSILSVIIYVNFIK